jgi:hypothetical protein
MAAIEKSDGPQSADSVEKLIAESVIVVAILSMRAF